MHVNEDFEIEKKVNKKNPHKKNYDIGINTTQKERK